MATPLPSRPQPLPVIGGALTNPVVHSSASSATAANGSFGPVTSRAGARAETRRRPYTRLLAQSRNDGNFVNDDFGRPFPSRVIPRTLSVAIGQAYARTLQFRKFFSGSDVALILIVGALISMALQRRRGDRWQVSTR